MSNFATPARRRHESSDHRPKHGLSTASSFDEHPPPPGAQSSSRVRCRTLSSEDSSPSYSSEDGNIKVRSPIKRFLLRQFHLWQHRIPFLKKLVAGYHRVPPRLRVCLLVLWLVWKFIITVILFRIVFQHGLDAFDIRTVEQEAMAALHFPMGRESITSAQSLKILYVVTALAEYNTGRRNTKAGQDRLAEVLVPVLVDGVESMVEPPFSYHVDVYLILGYKLLPERRQMIADRLPEGVGLQVWDDAIPFGYDKRYGSEKMIENTRTLARQHRYVIKDKLDEYDLFVAFEDDMRLTGMHVQHFVQVSEELDQMRRRAPKHLDDVPEKKDTKDMKFFGAMTEQQMHRLVPGFVRVEVLLNETQHGAQTKLDPIALDYDFETDNGGPVARHIDPSICCSVPNMKPNVETPKSPSEQDLIIWETNVKALSLRQLPTSSSLLDWVVLLPGPGKRLSDDEWIGGYWSGRDGAFGDLPRPSGGQPELVAQQGGWMATRDQIIRLNSGLCQGSFLPPFDPPMYNEDGQQSMNVEFWSGGYQFFTGVRGGCNMQRIISFDPDHFSKHLVYHVANNKQRQLARDRMLRADHLFAQLNTVKKNAEKAKATQIKQIKL